MWPGQNEPKQNQEVRRMFQQNLTLHETMEIHELLNLKTACLIKSQMVQGLVFDQDLKALLDKDVQQSVSAANVLQSLLTDKMQS
jgi:similar to spore coat protein